MPHDTVLSLYFFMLAAVMSSKPMKVLLKFQKLQGRQNVLEA